MQFLIQTESVNIILEFIKIYCITIFSYYFSLKITNEIKQCTFKNIIILIMAIFIVIVYYIIKNICNFFYSTIFLILSLTVIMSKVTKNNIGYSMIISIISTSINYVFYSIAIALSFFPNAILKIENRVIGFTTILIIYLIVIFTFGKIKKLKKGILFLQKNAKNDKFDILILNMSVIILFCITILAEYKWDFTLNSIFSLSVFSIIMFITIQKSLQLYYKQKILVKELEETKDELAKKNKEIEDLEAENISISKKSHTLSHKQKSLEYKIEQMLTKAEISVEEVTEVKERLKTIKEEFNKEKATIELDKTEISEIDDMLKYMQSECIKNKIDFELQIKGNIHYMTNNLITKEDLETLLADHIKNAIIAINHTDNVNRSILVRLGKIDETYGFFVYDSGVEFQKETLENLGKIPSTTHADEGGTGMGFMNTFDTLRKCKASLIIEEYNEPSKDNYTKAIIIKFDGKNEFKINSYREKYQKI